MTEREVQKPAVNALKKLGYKVCVTSNRRKTANTPGTPDVLVSIKDGLWVGLEFKRPKGGTLTEEQRELANEQRIIPCKSVDEAIQAVRYRQKKYTFGRAI